LQPGQNLWKKTVDPESLDKYKLDVTDVEGEEDDVDTEHVDEDWMDD
jgi:hypothetical protein